MIKIVHGNGASICSRVKTALSPDGKISFDERTSTLVVLDRPDYLPHIQELVASLDVKVPMVRMRIKIAEATDEFLKSAGIHSAQVIYPRGSFDGVERLLSAGSGIFTKSEMTLTTPSGSPVQLPLNIATLYPRADGKSEGLSATAVSSNRAGDILVALPLANYDNTMTVKILPSGSGINEELNERPVLTQVTLHSGDTLVVTGLRQQQTVSGGRRSFLMFLTAEIIYDQN